MSKITNDGLTLYSCTHMATVGVKELRKCYWKLTTAQVV